MVFVKQHIAEIWRKIIQNSPDRRGKPWVVFRHGTCVILMEGVSSKEEAITQATQIISEYGPVYAGSPAGDFNIAENSAGNSFSENMMLLDSLTLHEEG